MHLPAAAKKKRARRRSVRSSGSRRSCKEAGVKKTACALAALTALSVASLLAQVHDPKPAFAGQTKAPSPATPSPRVRVETVAGGLTGAWAIAFLPDGNF